MPRILADTNLLLRIADPGAAQHQSAAEAISRLIAGGHEVCICPQNIIEFWAVATRPVSANGFGWDISQTDSEISEMELHFVLLADTPNIYAQWKALVGSGGISGKRVHDARLAAVSLVNQCDAVLTFNTADFSAMPSLTLLNPDQLGSWPAEFTG